jgi:hypothetical protein
MNITGNVYILMKGDGYGHDRIVGSFSNEFLANEVKHRFEAEGWGIYWVEEVALNPQLGLDRDGLPVLYHKERGNNEHTES